MGVPVIAIDGPSASGKGTVAQSVARALEFHYLDSGALYRLVASPEATLEEAQRNKFDRLLRSIDLQPGEHLVEIVRRIMFDIDLDKLSGNVVGVPIANSFGFLRSSRYLPDRRDLNRYFPGDAQGSMAARFAHSLFDEVIGHCEVLVDIHTGSFYRTNLPQLRADLRITRVLNLTKQFGDIAVLHSEGPSGSLRRAATDVGIAAVTMETGGPARFQQNAVAAGVKAIEALLSHLGMVKRFRLFGEPQPVIYNSTWVRVETGGILLAEVGLGDIVEKGQRLGTVTDPIHTIETSRPSR